MQPPPDEPMAHLLADAAGIVRRRLPDARALDVRAADDGLRTSECSAARFPSCVIVAIAFFGAAPFLIGAAPYESTMGLVQKIFYFHAPAGHDHVPRRRASSGAASAWFLFTGKPSADRVAAAADGIDGAVRRHRADDGSALGPEGVGRLVAVGRPAHLVAPALDDVRGVPAGAEVRRARVGKARGGRVALRHGQRAVRLRLGERLAHGAPEDDRRAHAWRRDARAVLVLCRRRSCCCSSCCWPSACGLPNSRRSWKRSIWSLAIVRRHSDAIL